MDKRSLYQVIHEGGKFDIYLSDEGVERLRRKYQGFISITRVDNLDHDAIAKELGEK